MKTQCQECYHWRSLGSPNGIKCCHYAVDRSVDKLPGVREKGTEVCRQFAPRALGRPWERRSGEARERDLFFLDPPVDREAVKNFDRETARRK